MLNYAYRAPENSYIYYTVLRFIVDGEERKMIVRRDKSDKLGERVPVAYSKRHGVLLRRRCDIDRSYYQICGCNGRNSCYRKRQTQETI